MSNPVSGTIGRCQEAVIRLRSGARGATSQSPYGAGRIYSGLFKLLYFLFYDIITDGFPLFFKGCRTFPSLMHEEEPCSFCIRSQVPRKFPV